MTIIDKITIYSNDVNKTRASVQLLAMHILGYFVIKKKGIKSKVGLNTIVCSKWMNITPVRILSSLTNCFNKVIFLRFRNELKFHILSGDGKMFGL